MSEQIQGVVEVVTGPNKGGFYSLKIGETWYGLGKSKPSFDKGATVAFGFYLKDGKWATVKGDVKLVEQTSVASKTSTSQSSSKSSYQAKDDYWAAKEQYEREVVQPRISYYAAIERALGFADIVLREKAIPGLEKAKPEARLEIISSFVYEMADELVKRANASGKKAAPKVVAATPGNEQAETEQEGNWE